MSGETVIGALVAAIGAAIVYIIHKQEKKVKNVIDILGTEETETLQAPLTGLALTVDAAKKAGFTGEALVKAVAIAAAESDFNPMAEGDIHLQDSKWGKSIGLWQIRSLNNPYVFSYPDTLRVASKLYDPYYNAKAAYVISNNGTNFNPWSTFTHGNYIAHLPGVRDFLNLA